MGAHGECRGDDVGSGEARSRAGRRRGSRRPKVEDEVGEDARRLPSLRAWACRLPGPWRSSWTRRGDEGEAVAAATAVDAPTGASAMALERRGREEGGE